MTVEDEVAVLCTGLVKRDALAGVVLGQISGAVEVGRVVDGNNLDLGICLCDAEDKTADATKTVDANLDSHVRVLLFCRLTLR